MPPIPYAPKNLNILMKVELGHVFQTAAALAPGDIPCQLYIFSANKCKGVQINYMPIGVINCAILSEFFCWIPHESLMTQDTRGGKVNPPAIVSTSRLKKIKQVAGGTLAADYSTFLPNILAKVTSLTSEAPMLTAVVPKSLVIDAFYPVTWFRSL